jgi:nitroreductase
MEKPAATKSPIHELLAYRWSPRAFSPEPVEDDKLLSLFEAARWSPSAANAQPWAFILTRRGDGCHEQLVQILSGRNQAWAPNAPVLVLTVATPPPGSTEGAASKYSYYDLGQAVAHLSVQAAAVGLWVHQMGGFDHEAAKVLFGLPDGYEPMSVIAIGYQGDVNDLPDWAQERERAPRARKTLEEFVFLDRWAQSLP